MPKAHYDKTEDDTKNYAKRNSRLPGYPAAINRAVITVAPIPGHELLCIRQ
jgi:hypothetical protein